MMRFPYWFAETLIEYRKAHPLPSAKKPTASGRNDPEQNAFDRVFWEIGVVIAVALAVAAIAEVALRANGVA
jgi:hypothetical protein